MSVTLNNLEEMGPLAAFDSPQQGTKRGNNGPAVQPLPGRVFVRSGLADCGRADRFRSSRERTLTCTESLLLDRLPTQTT